MVGAGEHLPPGTPFSENDALEASPPRVDAGREARGSCADYDYVEVARNGLAII